MISLILAACVAAAPQTQVTETSSITKLYQQAAYSWRRIAQRERAETDRLSLNLSACLDQTEAYAQLLEAGPAPKPLNIWLVVELLGAGVASGIAIGLLISTLAR